ncbi:DUF5618 family protein [bacterium]|nr:DUF5618 family protein [bacterium]MBU1598867.1 DUF5618 family protein [bacterium]
MQRREAIRYIENAKELLSKSPIENNKYSDIKYVKSACGVAYLGVLRVIDDYLLEKGVGKKETPKKVEEYRKALQKYASMHNGKLLKDFDDIYDELHIAGYYRGMLHGVDTVKSSIKLAKDFIERLN